ncbi:unnamed protein product [Gemmataceae bacterium]|nr:unnamed protein product [Gemmataceae bacterium]VTU00766.1 unnamed protein product [Gemmataceae bacterium]
MRWKTVALAGALGPWALGCNIAQYTTHTLVNEVHVLSSLHGVEHKLRSEARRVWKEVRAQYPRRAFTAEFRDGFLDGYVDFLDRGGNCSVPAVPPAKYTRQKKYLTEEGQCLLRDYLLGFKYGQDIAVATGKRQLLTVPVLLPVVDDGPPQFRIEPRAGAATLPAPAPVTMPAPTPPPAPAPAAVPAPAPQPPLFPAPAGDAAGAGSSLAPLRTAVAAPPAPPAPVPAAPPAGAIPTAPAVKLPAPPTDVPEFPEYVPTPPVTDELPVVPPYRAELPVVPPSHPEATGK